MVQPNRSRLKSSSSYSAATGAGSGFFSAFLSSFLLSFLASGALPAGAPPTDPTFPSPLLMSYFIDKFTSWTCFPLRFPRASATLAASNSLPVALRILVRSASAG